MIKKIITKTFRFRLEPNKAQRNFFARFAGSCRYIYNLGLELCQASLQRGQRLSYADLCKELTALKDLPDHEWLSEPPSQSLQQSLKDVYNAFNRFHNPDKSGKKHGTPHFKKRGIKDSFRYPQGIKVENGSVFLPKVGWVR